MALHSTVPSSVEPDSFTDLADDCREVSSVLAPYVIDLTKVPAPRQRLAFLVPAQSAAVLEGYDTYGS